MTQTVDKGRQADFQLTPTPEEIAAAKRALIAWHDSRHDFDFGARLLAGAVLRASREARKAAMNDDKIVRPRGRLAKRDREFEALKTRFAPLLDPVDPKDA